MWDSRRSSFNVTQVSGELRKVFKKAGIRKTELEKSETAVAILEGLVEHQVENLLQEEGAGQEPSSQDDLSLPATGVNPSPDDIDAVLDQKISLISQHRKQTITATQSQIMHNIESGQLLPRSLLSPKAEEQRLTALLTKKIEERRQQLHIYDSSGDSSSDSDWSDSD